MVEGWNQKSIVEVADFINGGAWSDKEYVEKGIPVVRVSNIKNGSIDFSDCKFLPNNALEKYGKNELKSNDLIVCTVGSHPQVISSAVGRTCRVKQLDSITLLNQNAAIIRANSEDVIQGWINYVSKSILFSKYISDHARGSANQARMSIGLLKQFPLPLPPIKEQKRIAEIFGALDDKIEVNLKMNKTLEEMAQALYKEWFVDFGPVIDKARQAGNPIPAELETKAAKRRHLKPDEIPYGLDQDTYALFPDSFEDSKLGPIPKGWEVTSIYDLAQYVNGGAFKQKELGVEGLPIIKIADLKRGISNSTQRFAGEYKPKNLIKDGDILFAWSASLDIFLWAEGKALLNQHIFNVLPAPGFSKEFLFITLKHFIKEFQSIAADRATTMGHITKEHLIQASKAMPEINLFEKFEDKLKPILNALFSNLKENQTLTQTRDALLPKLISGEVQVKLDRGTV